jgi:hypothetical protein
MQRIDLAVPYAERESVRRLGARWDPGRRLWFVPPECDATPFARWLPLVDPANIRATGYFIASTTCDCWRCHGPSPVCGFALGPGYEALYVDDDAGGDCWEESDEPTFVCYLDYLLPSVVARIVERTVSYRYRYRRRTQSFYWANVCSSCGAKLGDYETFCEPGQGFMPLTRDDAARITLRWVDEPFIANAGGWSLGVELFDCMIQQ